MERWEMEDLSFEEAVKKEERKIKRELKKAKISTHKMKVLESVIAHASWQKVKLDELKNQITESEIVVEYNNGGGQEGTRINPLFKAYEALWKDYMMGMGRILGAFPEEKQVELKEKIDSKQPTVLDLVREKKRSPA